MEKTVIIDIEANGFNPDKIHFVVCRDYETDEVHVFRNPENDPTSLIDYISGYSCIVGHHILGYDLPVLNRLVKPEFAAHCRKVDTLVLSRLLDHNIAGGHSIEAWGVRLGVPKVGVSISDWSVPTQLMLDRCISDTAVNSKLLRKFQKYLDSPNWQRAIEVEHFIQARCRELHENGFHFSLDKAKELWYTIDLEVKELDDELKTAFPPKVYCVRTIEPRITKHGTLNRNDFRWAGSDLSYFNGGPFSLIEYVEFNPGSPAQIVERLNEAGWQPVEKTKGHIEAIRSGDSERIAKFAKTGWTVSEENLNTLPDTAPPAAKKLARRILLGNRLSTLNTWIEAYNHETGRIHGSFNGIGAWTQRMSHTNPNTGNITRDDAIFGAEMRAMWGAAPGALLVGVDAESIQLRVLAHYINDPEFTQSLLTGKKEDGTDPHSLNQKALGGACRSRNDAKTFNDLMEVSKLIELREQPDRPILI